jgi:hypothetical protein
LRPSQKTILHRPQTSSNGLPSDFNKDDFDALQKSKGNTVIHEKAYLCPCKSNKSDHLTNCRNCAGTGWIFANPIETNMIIIGIAADNKFKEAILREMGMLDMGMVKVTAYNDDKLAFMDRITLKDATAEHSQLVYPTLTNDSTELFAYTKYDIKSIDYIALFEGSGRKVKRLIEPTDYSFRDNVLIFDSQYNSLEDPCVTIRYIHNPVFHIVDILRESMTSPTIEGVKQILQVHAIAKRAHLVSDVENFDGDKLFDNSWLTSCNDLTSSSSLTQFQRQLRHTSSQDIYDNLTSVQREQLALLLA